MPPRKGTNAWKEEIIRTFYGINPKTFGIDSVSVSRGGTLTKWSSDGHMHTHPIHHGGAERAQAEIVIVYDLTDLFSVIPGIEDSETTKRKINELRSKAALMKEEHEKRKSKKDDSSS